MPVPGTEEIRRALLEILKGENPQSITVKEWMTLAAEHLGVTALIQTRDSGEFKDRIIESLQYLMNQNMISNPSRYAYMITKKGQNVLEGTTGRADDENFGEGQPVLQREMESIAGEDAEGEDSDSDALPDALDIAGEDAEGEDSDTDALPGALDIAGEDTNGEDSDADALPDDLDMTGNDAEGENSDALPDDSDMTGNDADGEDSDALPDDLNMTSDDADGETPDALLDDSDMTGDDAEGKVPDALPDNLDTASDDADGEGTDALPDDLNMTSNDADSETPDALPDDLDMAGDDADGEDSDALPDDLDMTSDDATGETPDAEGENPDALPDDIDMADNDTAGEDSDALPDDLNMTSDNAEGENPDALPDDLDMTSDDAEGKVPDTDSETPDALPDDLNIAGNDTDSETPDALPDDLDIAGDDTEEKVPDAEGEDSDTDSEIPDALDEKIFIPESSETISDDSGSLASQQNIHTAANTAPENTLNFIDEVEPDMPKDDLQTDDFPPTEDFSGAVNQTLNIDDVLERHNTELADKVLLRAAGLSPEMFAVFVTDLLSKMGYSAFQTARYTPESEGSSMIQGVILDPKAKTPIYIHADKLSPGRTVGRSDMHDFADELAEKGGTGIFATTGEFSEQVRTYAQDEHIMLIDGKRLAGLMIANNFCVNVEKVFEVKELDEDSFSEYE